MFVTARHVVDCDSSRETRAIVLVPEQLGSKARLLGIEYIAYSERHSDVAVFVVKLPSDSSSRSEWTRLSLALTEPRAGERCLAVGYPQIREDEARFNRNLVAADGSIEEVHHNKRDRSFITFPSFRTNAMFLPGISGGPILNQEGYVVGVVSTGTEVTGLDEHGLAYGACVLATAELSIELHDEDGVLHKMHLRELIGRGLTDASNGRVRLTRDADGVTLQWKDSAPE